MQGAAAALEALPHETSQDVFREVLHYAQIRVTPPRSHCNLDSALHHGYEPGGLADRRSGLNARNRPKGCLKWNPAHCKTQGSLPFAEAWADAFFQSKIKNQKSKIQYEPSA